MSALSELIESMSAVERREAIRFLRSPFFNRRTDVIRLFEALCVLPHADREKHWSYVFEKESFEDQKFRLLQSYLHKLLERFLVVSHQLEDSVQHQLALTAIYRARNMHGAFEKTRKLLEKQMTGSALRNEAYHEALYLLDWQKHQLQYRLDPTDVSVLRDLSVRADVAFLSRKLRLACLLTAHGKVYQSGGTDPDLSWIVSLAEREDYRREPAVEIYRLCYIMLTRPNDESCFTNFKRELLACADRFSTDELHALNILALNFCVRRINEGQERYNREALDLYKSGLEKGFIFDNGVLSRFAYYNITAAGLQAGELEWVRFFIHEYKNRLEKKYRESLFSFNLARLEYACKNFGYVLELLQYANYRDILLNLSAKTLLIKTYYELDEFDALTSSLDAMRNYIRRKRVIGYHRTNYLNIVRYMEKLISLNQSDRTALELFRNSLNSEMILSEKTFFLSQTGFQE
jgi:hypothetical protein